MKTQVQSTSIDCYHAIRHEGRLSHQQSIIMDVVRAGRNYSLQELVRLTGLQINAISGRVSELKASGLLIQGPTRKCSVTGRTIHSLGLPTKQMDLLI